MGWRKLTEQEETTLPQARLGGLLLAAVVAASLLCLVELAGLIFALDRLLEIGSRYTVAVTFGGLLSLVFVVMTLLRIPQTPIVISAGLVLWILYRGGVGISYGAVAHWPLVVDMLGEFILAAGFCGYMAGGLRPNAYYRRRIPSV
ncbi:MAG: hypothetical protein J0H44_28235 [Alphaproteobacteria bacterium]|nr:hypothetical protein [Alphaproteobacteria bacterium]